MDTAAAVVRSFLRGSDGLDSEWDERALVQECLTAWWLKRDQYDPARGANRRTFMNRVCESRLLDIARRDRAQRRGGGRRTVSLDVPVTADGDPLIHLLADGSPTPQQEVESSDLASRLANLRERLSGRQRAVFDGLSREQPIAGLARDLDVSRDTLYEDIRRIRGLCRDAGLDEFLQ
jgi:DNA-directed RNA polymerase specialized sigma24 family protein